MSDKVFTQLDELCESEDRLTEIESLCNSCGDNGMTRLLLTEIPFFKQVVVVSFECPHCGHTNNELQPAQQIAEKGIRFVVKCRSPQDLKRLVVKTEWAEIQVPEVEFEVKKQTGLITTIEGILGRAVEGLEHTIQISDQIDCDSRQKINDFVVKMNRLKEGNEWFTFIITDVSGNSFVESLCAPDIDPNVESNHFIRGLEEDKLLGIYSDVIDEEEETEGVSAVKNEVLQFATNCPNCNVPVFTNMKVTQIPHFKEVVIMATNCDSCGHKTNEVKSGAGMGEKAMKITLRVCDDSDLKREVVISDTCEVNIPELDIHVGSTGSGRYTTVEGIASNIKDDLMRANPFIGGDSTKEEIRKKLDTLFDKLSDLKGYTIVLDDPCGNSYIEGQVDVLTYERTFEQNEELGLNDIKTENYS